MKENLKISLLILIALMCGYNFYINMQDSFSENDTKSKSSGLIADKSFQNKNLNHSNNPLTPSNEEPKTKLPTTIMSFNEMSYDFGTIKQNTTNNLHVFKFQNKGSNPLVIENAKGSCGCTVPDYPKEPIMPNQWGEIKVDYKPGKQEGSQNKTVTITANTDNPTTILKISAMVEKEEQAGASQ